MKKILSFSLFVLLFIGISSCSNDDDAAVNQQQAAQGEMIAEVDGNPFSSNSTNTGAYYYQNLLSLSGTSNIGTIILTVPEITATGTFDLAYQNLPDAAGVFMVSGEDGYMSEAENGGSGQLVITKFDLQNNLVSGTFEFTAIRHNVVDPQNPSIETVVVSKGSFTDVSMIIDEIPGDPISTLSAKVDGVQYTPTSVHSMLTTFGGESTITVNSNNPTTKQNISLRIPSNITVGTHQFSSMPGSGINGMYHPNMGTSNKTYISISGSINITSYNATNKTMEGTFFFTARDFMQEDPTLYEITEGAFKIEY